MIYFYFFFFFQAEDGIRDIGVTGVQTCALPICRRLPRRRGGPRLGRGGGPADRRRGGPGRRAGEQRRRLRPPPRPRGDRESGRAACRGRGEISVVAVSFKKKNNGERTAQCYRLH